MDRPKDLGREVVVEWDRDRARRLHAEDDTDPQHDEGARSNSREEESCDGVVGTDIDTGLKDALERWREIKAPVTPLCRDLDAPRRIADAIPQLADDQLGHDLVDGRPPDLEQLEAGLLRDRHVARPH